MDGDGCVPDAWRPAPQEVGRERCTGTGRRNRRRTRGEAAARLAAGAGRDARLPADDAGWVGPAPVHGLPVRPRALAVADGQVRRLAGLRVRRALQLPLALE